MFVCDKCGIDLAGVIAHCGASQRAGVIAAFAPFGDNAQGDAAELSSEEWAAKNEADSLPAPATTTGQVVIQQPLRPQTRKPAPGGRGCGQPRPGGIPGSSSRRRSESAALSDPGCPYRGGSLPRHAPPDSVSAMPDIEPRWHQPRPGPAVQKVPVLTAPARS